MTDNRTLTIKLKSGRTLKFTFDTPKQAAQALVQLREARKNSQQK